MNVAGIQVIKMDEKADVTGGEPAATGGETGATGTACDGCETDKDIDRFCIVPFLRYVE